jgi:hypothetical protein
MPWTESQQLALAVIPKISSTLSVLGSGSIIYDVLCRKPSRANMRRSRHGSANSTLVQRKRQQPYFRIMFAMSVSDFFLSSAYFFSTWPIPPDTDQSWPVVGNIGTIATCSTQGFFIQLGIMVPLYTGFLVLYYFVTIRLGWTDSKFQNRVGRWGHGIIVLFGMGTAVAGLFLTLYNNAILWCWIGAYPFGCLQSFRSRSHDTGYDNSTTIAPCQRGGNAYIYRFVFWYIPVWSMFLWVTIGMWMVYGHVLKHDKKMERYLSDYTSGVPHRSNVTYDYDSNNNYDSSNINVVDNVDQPSDLDSNKNIVDDVDQQSKVGTASSDLLVTPKSTPKPSRIIASQASGTVSSLRRAARVRSNAVAVQGVLYVLVFVAVYTFPTVTRTLQLADIVPPYPLFLLTAMMAPLQGFFNSLVFFRPRLVQYLGERRKKRTKPASARQESPSSEQGNQVQQQEPEQLSTPLSLNTDIAAAAATTTTTTPHEIQPSEGTDTRAIKSASNIQLPKRVSFFVKSGR